MKSRPLPLRPPHNGAAGPQSPLQGGLLATMEAE